MYQVKVDGRVYTSRVNTQPLARSNVQVSSQKSEFSPPTHYFKVMLSAPAPWPPMDGVVRDLVYKPNPEFTAFYIGTMVFRLKVGWMMHNVVQSEASTTRTPTF